MHQTLQNDFSLRKKFFTNRASAIFPIYFMSSKNDLILSWLNYWTIKNGIAEDYVSINIRIYDEEGNLHVRETLAQHQDSNAISLREFIEYDTFKGMVELEVVSVENIKFAFPAIIGFYKTGSLFSCVHSAGRIKGTDEYHDSLLTEETNWSCKFEKDIVPFFHYVNGGCEEKVHLIINLYSLDGNIVEVKEVHESFSAFSSKIYFLDSFFDCNEFSDGMFVGIKCKNDTVFRRMVVGNFHKSVNHLEVTHTFPKQTLEDYCPLNKNGYESFLALCNDEELSLSARVFPTNCSSRFKVEESNQSYESVHIGGIVESSKLKNGFGFVEIESERRLKVLWLSGNTVPSRLNCNFIYRVKDTCSKFSTDIATGAKSSVYPPKYSHWGSGLFGEGYDFVLMIRNLSHNLDSSSSKGILSIYGLGETIKLNIELHAESADSIKLSDILNTALKKQLEDKATIFNWYLKLDQPSAETFWVSFRKTDGCIVGEHGF